MKICWIQNIYSSVRATSRPIKLNALCCAVGKWIVAAITEGSLLWRKAWCRKWIVSLKKIELCGDTVKKSTVDCSSGEG